MAARKVRSDRQRDLFAGGRLANGDALIQAHEKTTDGVDPQQGTLRSFISGHGIDLTGARRLARGTWRQAARLSDIG
jgi:hypothetical protein